MGKRRSSRRNDRGFDLKGMWGSKEQLEKCEFQRAKNTEGGGLAKMAGGEDRVRDRAPSSASAFEAQHHGCSTLSK